MAFTDVLRLLIDADTGGAVRGITAVGQATDKHLGKSQKTIDKWSKGLTTAGAGMVAFGAAGLLGLGKAAQASEEANLSVVKLQNSLANNPRLAGENVKSFTDLADAIQGKTAADADAIVEGAALLGTFKLQGDEIRSLLPLVTDYARKFGVSIPDAAVQVGKALDGQVGALKRNGVSIDEVLFKTDRYAAVTQALRGQVGGFAEAEGKTFAGSLERMKNELGDLAEGIGGGAVDAFSTLFGVVDDVTGALDKLSPGAQNAIGKFATFGSVALVAAGGLSFTVGQLLKMQQNFALASTAAQSMIGSLGGVGRMARITGGLLATGLIVELINLERQRPSLQEIPRDLENIVKASRELNQAGGPEAIRNWTLEVGDLDDALDKILESSPGLAASFLQAAEAAGIPAAKISELRARVEEHRQTASEATAANQEWNESLEGTASAAQDAADSISALLDPLFGATDALMENQEANAAVTQAELELAAAQRDHGASSLEAQAAQQALTDAQLAAGRSALGLTGAMAQLEDGVRNGTVSVVDARATLQGWVAQGLISKSTANALAKQFDATAGAANRLGATDPNVKVSATDNASSVIRFVSRQLDALSGRTVFTSVVTSYRASGSNPLQTFGGRRQHGGPVTPDKSYLVGEKGPELFVPREHGMVVPASSPYNHGGGGGWGSPTVNVTLDMRGAVVANEAQFERMVAQAWNKATRGGLLNIKSSAVTR